MESPQRRRRALTVTAEIAETLSRRYRCRMIGVCRGAPRCAGRWESTGTHIRRGTPAGRSGAPRFFYRDPAIPLPARDGRVIALDGAPLGFLARPAERGEQPALSFAKTSAAGQVVDLSALILTHSRLNDHSPAPPASAAPVPLRRSPPPRDREPRPASATRRVQEDGAPAPASHDGPPLLGRTGQSL